MLFLITFQCREDFLSGKICEFENDGQKGASRIRAILFEITYIAKQDGVCPKTIIGHLWVLFLIEYMYTWKILSSWWASLFWDALTFLYHRSEKERELCFEKEQLLWKKCFGGKVCF